MHQEKGLSLHQPANSGKVVPLERDVAGKATKRALLQQHFGPPLLVMQREEKVMSVRYSANRCHSEFTKPKAAL